MYWQAVPRPSTRLSWLMHLANMQGDDSPIGPLRLQLPDLTANASDSKSAAEQRATVLLDGHQSSAPDQTDEKEDSKTGSAAGSEDNEQAAGPQNDTKRNQGVTCKADAAVHLSPEPKLSSLLSGAALPPSVATWKAMHGLPFEHSI